MTAPTDKPRCAHIKADGTPCRSFMGIDPVTGFCIAHDVVRRDELRKRQGAGGRASNEGRKRERRRLPAKMPRRPETLEDAEKYQTWLAWALLVGEIDARTCEAATKAIRQYELIKAKRGDEEELKKLRAELAEARRERPRLA